MAGDVLANLGIGVFSVIVIAFQSWLVAAISRRVLGVPVGWPRSIVVGIVMTSSLAWAVQYLFKAANLGNEKGLNTDPGVALAFGVIAAFWIFAFGVAVLVGLEIVVPTGSLPTARSLFTGWAARRRRGRRYTEVVGIAARHGLASQFRGFRRRDSAGQEARTARSLRLALEEGGVAFVKLGQMLSTRADLLPEPYIRELSLLQTQVAPETWEDVSGALDAGLGRPASSVFASVEREPLASASVAQVHRATLTDGTAVVVKVQRPSARAQVERDVEIILRLARWLSRTAPWARQLGAEDLARGFADSLAEELDYRVELDNMRSVAAALGRKSGVRVPVAYPELSGPTLLVMEAMPGQPLTRAGDILAGLAPEERSALAARLLTVTLDQMITVGVFHADLHPGNILVLPDGGLGLLDFGSVGRLDPQSKMALGLLLNAIENQDNVGATDALLELLDRPEELDERAVEREVGQLITRYRGGFSGAGSQEMFQQLFGMVMRRGFAVPRQIAAAFRALGALEGSIALIEPGFDVVGTAREHGRRLMHDQLGPGALKEQLEAKAIQALPMLARLPRRIDRITDSLERGRFQVNVRFLADRRDRAFVTAVVQQLIVAVLAGAATIGAIMLITSENGPIVPPGVSLHAMMGYFLLFAGFVLSLRSVALVFAQRGDDG